MFERTEPNHQWTDFGDVHDSWNDERENEYRMKSALGDHWIQDEPCDKDSSAVYTDENGMQQVYPQG